MKKLIIISTILIAGIFTTVKSETKIINHSGFEFGFFYTNLAPYGSWVELEAGLIVWQPTVMNRNWSPYREGRWIWTVDGWYWDSYEPFGYIVYHYGRWYFDDYYGWIWIPDYEWAPAWVEWRYDNSYIGWAPLPPYAVFSIHIGIHYTHNYYVPYHHWHYVSYNRFCDPYVYNYYVAPKYKYRIHSKTKVRNNYGYRNGHVVNNGVDVDVIRKRTGQNIRQRDVIGVKDYREVEKYRGKNDDDVVRTFIASRDELTKTRVSDINDVKIERRERKTSLDVSKVRLGREDISGRNSSDLKDRSAGRDSEVKRNETITREKNNSNINRNNDIEVRKNDKVKTERRTNVIIPEKKVERKDVRKNNPVNNDVIRGTEVKRETSKRNNVEQQKKTVIEKKVNEPRKNNVQRKSETNSNRNINQERKSENKVQVRTQTKTNNQPRVKTQERKVEKKTNTKTDERRRR